MFVYLFLVVPNSNGVTQKRTPVPEPKFCYVSGSKYKWLWLLLVLPVCIIMYPVLAIIPFGLIVLPNIHVMLLLNVTHQGVTWTQGWKEVGADAVQILVIRIDRIDSIDRIDRQDRQDRQDK